MIEILKCFHWFDHGKKTHCRGVTHVDGRHVINREFAIGHGEKRIPILFKFTEPCPTGGFYLDSAVLLF